MMKVENEYKTTKLGKIPGDWEFDNLDSITVGHKQGYYTKEAYSNIGTKLIRITDLRNQTINYDSMPKLEISAADYQAYKVKSGDFLFARSGAIGRYGIVRNFDEKAIFASYIIRFRFNQKKALNDFIGYFYQSYYSKRQLSRITQGSSNININANNIKSMRIPLPPIKEQQKIAKILSTVDEQIEQTDQLIEKTKELKKGLMQQLLSKGIDHTNFKKSEYGLIPINWTIKKIEYICDYRKEKIDPLKSERKKYIALENIEQNTGRINGYLSSDDSTSMKSVFKKGDTIFNKLRPYLNKYWYATFDGVCATELLPLTSKNETDSLFLYYCLQQDRVLGYVTKRTFGTKMPRTSWKELKEISILIPLVNEQKKIASILSSVDEDMDGYEQEKSKYEELKKGLMQQLLTGKTRVKVD